MKTAKWLVTDLRTSSDARAAVTSAAPIECVNPRCPKGEEYEMPKRKPMLSASGKIESKTPRATTESGTTLRPKTAATASGTIGWATSDAIVSNGERATGYSPS